MTDKEYNFKLYLLNEAMNRHLLGYIPTELLNKLDTDEQASVIIGLLEELKTKTEK